MSSSWDTVKDETIIHSFKACGISSALDGSEDNLLSDKVAEALNAADQANGAARGEAIDLILGDSDTDEDDGDADFEGFTDVSDDENEGGDGDN